LIPVGMLLLLAVAASALLRDVPLNGQGGNVVERPTSVAALQQPYQLGAGDLTIDLSTFPFGAQATTVKAELGAGDLTVIVPEGQPVKVHARVKAGEIHALGRHQAGLDVRSDFTEGSPSRQQGQLTLDLQLTLGDVRVERGASAVPATGG
ncbi:MAG TPA: LiaF domain-containing protein, partial [Actinomycetes bacterium]|nr:LiaF domain-containing protein [Actinomycetes bacterium]